MRIEVIKQIVDDTEIYKIKKMEYCCQKLKRNPMIKLFNEYIENAYCHHCNVPDDFDCKDCELQEEADEYGKRLSMMIQEKDTYPEPWEDGYITDYRYYPIEYCPHCGQPIEIEIIKEEDVTEQYKRLVEQKNAIYKKMKSTDSKKKERELSEEVCLITQKLNNMYEDCAWYMEET